MPSTLVILALGMIGGRNRYVAILLNLNNIKQKVSHQLVRPLD
jgi:hypothetical protein